MCETERKNIFPGECFFPRMRKRKIACKEPSELKIFQEIFSFFVNRTKKPHKWKKKPFSCQNSFIQSVSHMYLKTILLIFSPKSFIFPSVETKKIETLMYEIRWKKHIFLHVWNWVNKSFVSKIVLYFLCFIL